MPNLRTSDRLAARWTGGGRDVLIELKRSSNARDVRDALLGLAYVLSNEPATSRALCLLANSRLTTERLSDELNRFHSVVRKDLVSRIMLVTVDDKGRFMGALPKEAAELKAFLSGLLREKLGASADRVSRESVKSHLINLWINGQPAQTLAKLRIDTGASHPTVSAALKDLDRQGLLNTGPKGVRLTEPTADAWRRLAESHAHKRRTVSFVDPSGYPRPPGEMLKRLKSLQERGRALTVAVSGVAGAAHYYPDLDITGPPRLDLSVFDGDLRFVEQIDAGLVASDGKEANAVLVVHFDSGDEGFVENSEFGRIAPPLDCLADLFEIGLTAEARDFALALTRRANLMQRIKVAE